MSKYEEMLDALHAEAEGEALAFIRAEVEVHGSPPSVRELAAHLGVGSSETALKVLRRLQRKGLIEVAPRRARGIVIVGSPMVADTEVM